MTDFIIDRRRCARACTFDSDHAALYGLPEAVFLDDLLNSLVTSAAKLIDAHPVPPQYHHAGQLRTWTRYSLQAICHAHPYWTKTQVRRVIESLHKQGVILKGKFNQDVQDQTLWYALADEEEFRIVTTARKARSDR